MVIGLVFANIFQPGSGLSISTEGLKAKEVAPPTLVDVFLNIVPINPIEALSKGNMLQIIFFALLFGFGLSVIGDKGKQVLHFFDGAADVMIKVTGFVMLYAPIGVFGLMAYTVSMHGLGVLLPLIKLVLVMYLACILQILIVYLPCVKVTGLTTSRFLKGLASPMMIAFTTCSSAAALSTTLLSVQKLGASRSVSSFSIPLGNTINMDGAAIYMGIAAIFAAEVYGIPMPLDRQLTVILLAVLASIGSMGVPGAALVVDHDGLHAGRHPVGSHRSRRRRRPHHGHGPHHHQRAWRRHGRPVCFKAGKRFRPRTRRTARCGRITRPETFPGGERRGKFPSAAGTGDNHATG